MSGRPTIIRNPPGDSAFRKAIDELLESGVRDPGEAQERLRQRYPRAVVRPRELANEPQTWYVYREGRWVSTA